MDLLSDFVVAYLRGWRCQQQECVLRATLRDCMRVSCCERTIARIVRNAISRSISGPASSFHFPCVLHEAFASGFFNFVGVAVRDAEALVCVHAHTRAQSGAQRVPCSELISGLRLEVEFSPAAPFSVKFGVWPNLSRMPMPL